MAKNTNLRFDALKDCAKHHAERFHVKDAKISEYFGINVFDRETMRKYLSADAFAAVENAIDGSEKIDRKYADPIAAGMKNWAVERGATHYTHWFQPLNEATAEKHDAFIELDKNSRVFESFKGDLLVQQEPDASSFPSGGLRNTFEARGYTAWDPSSPAFIIEKTLCIPTVFVSYTGESLDLKTPLLKAQAALDKAATKVCQLFDKDVKRVFSTLGLEQEYFLIDNSLFNARPDLLQTGRTLMGHTAAKDQQLEDHYFGSIPSRASAFMKDLETEAYKLGIPLKTRHNEVAPHQFECAPSFEEANLAIDHNLVLMSLMRRIAKQHQLKVIFHEKPFAGINGSGKHSNWSMMTDKGKNLLSPGKTPRTNLQFLAFFVCTISAASEHGYLLMSSVANLSNSYRLGGNEAPPSILSVFLGKTLSEVLNSLENTISTKKMTPDEKTDLKLNIVGKIPEIMPDNTDRNRTSPFAFTGNRFEFRAVGSSSNPASSMIILNAAVAQQLTVFYNEVETFVENGMKKDEAIFQVLRKFIKESRKILFDGNGYSPEWHKEAKKRGLKSINNIQEAFGAYLLDSSRKLFSQFGILSEKELEARYEIMNETYMKKIQIESRVLGDLAINHIIPIAIRYQNVLIENIRGLKEFYSEEEFKQLAEPQLNTLKEISLHVKEIRLQVEDMIEERKKANVIEDIIEKAKVYAAKVLPYLNSIRYHIDKLELEVDDSIWSLPKYRELLFLH
ncbi:MAG: glutamine synthetase III [Prevotellaceae bacterium]|jgi:glutamine synthetase|nr:glutamine synthetase III [Prevotellaceae bacterium]